MNLSFGKNNAHKRAYFYIVRQMSGKIFGRKSDFVVALQAKYRVIDVSHIFK